MRVDQSSPAGASGRLKSCRSAFERIGIEELPAPEEIAVDRREGRLSTGLCPVRGDGFNLRGDDRNGFLNRELELRGGLNAKAQPAEIAVADDPHGLRCFTARAALRTDVISGSEGQGLAVPEGRMVARMIVGVSAQDVEGQPTKQLAKRFPRLGKTVADNIRKQIVAGIGSHHLVELEQRQRGDHVPAEPAAIGALAVEPLDEQDVLSERVVELHRRNIEAGGGGEAHCQMFGLDDREQIPAR